MTTPKITEQDADVKLKSIGIFIIKYPGTVK
jgi:hypothetical protein